VDRGGQKQDITLNVAQVATDASKDLEGSGVAAAEGATPAPATGGPTPFNAPPSAPPAASPTTESPNE
jgi:hypothetical protein